MDSHQLIDSLSRKSLYELFRIKNVIDKLLEDPAALGYCRNNLKVGQSLSYFDPDSNQEIRAVLSKIYRTKALVKNIDDSRYWTIPLYMINREGLPMRLPNRSRIDRLNLKVGDSVGFLNRAQEACYGQVEKLNTKTASVKLASGQIWRVAYSLLFYVTDAQAFEKGSLFELPEIIV
jgi:hypothetical protein